MYILYSVNVLYILTSIKLSESGVLSLGAGLGATGSAVSAFSGAT